MYMDKDVRIIYEQYIDVWFFCEMMFVFVGFLVFRKCYSCVKFK